MPDIRKLIEAVEDGTWGNPKDAFPDHNSHMLGFKAFCGSLDAAKELHEVLLGYDWDIEAFGLNGDVILRSRRPFDRQYGFADMDPARAWLLAILRAYDAQQ